LCLPLAYQPRLPAYPTRTCPTLQELRTRPDIIVATPGRLLDHLRNSMGVTCEDVDVLGEWWS